MSWRRIDENTYIDNTLITCAEYQLFIDEIREEHFSYLQPDHWTSYQFPEGQARDPILGVRYSEANSFCEWLTSRDANEWLYRFPTTLETKKYPLKPEPDPLYLGYWIMDASNQSRFVWHDIVPVELPGIATEPARTRLHNKIIESARSVRSMPPHKFNPDRERYLHNALDRAFDGAVSRILDHALDLDRSLNHVHTSVLDHLNGVLDRGRVHELALRLDTAISRALTSTFFLLEKDIDLVCEVCIDINTLQERIAGRSPAFEGIRLVKERIR